MHHETTNNTSTSATVAMHRNSLTELISLSARPQITYVKPWYQDGIEPGYPRLPVGKVDVNTAQIDQSFSGTLLIEGYSFDKVTNIYVSAGGDSGIYDHTSSLSAISAFNPFSDALPISAKDLLTLYPKFSGFELESRFWMVRSDNVINVTLSAMQQSGNVDLIILNPAGYSLLSKDLSGSTISVIV